MYWKKIHWKYQLKEKIKRQLMKKVQQVVLDLMTPGKMQWKDKMICLNTQYLINLKTIEEKLNIKIMKKKKTKEVKYLIYKNSCMMKL